MKKLQIMLAFVLAIALSGTAMAAEVKLGYVNLQRALNECSAGKEAVIELEAETKKRQEQVDIKQEELKKLNEEIEKKRAVWSEDMRDQKQKELQAKMQEFQRFYLQSNEDIKKREQEKKTVIIKDLIELAKPLGIDKAKDGEITFIANPKYATGISNIKASAIIVSPDIKVQEGKNFLYVKNPYLAFAKVLVIFNPPAVPPVGIHPESYVHQTATIGSSVSIYPHVYIAEDAVIGNKVVLYPGVFIGKGVSIGDETIAYSNVSVREGCSIGKRVMIHCNAVVGSDGFGFAKDGARYHKIPQCGIVRIEDDVEIGACVTIDRATLGETIIKRGTKIDNLVHIAHNV